MAFSWKFFNEVDQKSVDELCRVAQHLKENHDKLQMIRFADVKEDEVAAIENLMKKNKKKLEGATAVLAEFDKELDQLTKAIADRLSQ